MQKSQGWYLGEVSSRAVPREGLPTFEGFKGYFRAVPDGCRAILFLPSFEYDMSIQYRAGSDPHLSAYLLEAGSSTRRMHNKLSQIFSEFEEKIGQGPERPKLVAVQRGHTFLINFMSKHYKVKRWSRLPKSKPRAAVGQPT